MNASERESGNWQQTTGQRRKRLTMLQALSFLMGKPAIVGDIQRHLGVLPAQMSRVMQALEEHAPPLVHCQIDSDDRRRVLVQINENGRAYLVNNLSDLLIDAIGMVKTLTVAFDLALDCSSHEVELAEFRIALSKLLLTKRQDAEFRKMLKAVLDQMM